MIDLMDRRYAVIDVEGNGQQPPDLVELAVAPIADGAISEPQAWLVRPARPIRPFAARIHGIRNRDVSDAPPLAAVQDEVLGALDGAVLVAHNAHVDVGVLRRELDGWQVPEVLDTLKLARQLLPGQSSYKLGALVNELNLADELPAELVPHRATYDVLVTARLFLHLATVEAQAEEPSLF